MKMVKSLDKSELLIKGLCEIIKNEEKSTKVHSLENALAVKGVITAGKGAIRAGRNFQCSPSFN